MAIRHNTLNNYFRIENGRAISLGSTRPGGLTKESNLRGRFAKVVIRSGIKRASTFKAASSSSAFDRIRRSIRRARVNTRVRLGKPVGKKNGKTIYRSVAGYTKVRD